MMLAAKEFIDFFQKNGFSTQESVRKVTATSGKHQAVLEFHDPDIPLMGVQTRFDLKFRLTQQMDFIVFLNPKGSRLKVTTKIISNDPNERLKEDIKEMEESKKTLIQRIENFPNEIWDLELRLNNNRGHEIENNRFDSMKELLESIIQFQ